jgi:hypothetical protein
MPKTGSPGEAKIAPAGVGSRRAGARLIQSILPAKSVWIRARRGGPQAAEPRDAGRRAGNWAERRERRAVRSPGNKV